MTGVYTWRASKRWSQSGRAASHSGLGASATRKSRRPSAASRARTASHTPRPQPVRRVEKHHGDAGDAEPRRLASVVVQEAREVRRHARGAPAPELPGLVVGRQNQASLAGVAEQRG